MKWHRTGGEEGLDEMERPMMRSLLITRAHAHKDGTIK